MKFSADEKDSGEVFPAAKRRRRRRGRRNSLASEQRCGEEEDAMENGSAGGWIAIYSGGSDLTD